jgi:hypothetical protein
MTLLFRAFCLHCYCFVITLRLWINYKALKVVRLLFAQRFITIFNCRHHTSNHLSVCHKPTSLSPINCQSVDNCYIIINTLINLHDPIYLFISRMDWVSCAGDINLPHNLPPTKKSSTIKSCDQYFWKFPIWNSRADEKHREIRMVKVFKWYPVIDSPCPLVQDSSAVRQLFVRLAGAVGHQSALYKENSGFAAPTLGRHISTFLGYQILFSIRNP